MKKKTNYTKLDGHTKISWLFLSLHYVFYFKHVRCNTFL